MLKTKIIERIRPSSKTLELFNNTNPKITNGYIQTIEKTNIKQVFPIVYEIDSHIIYEFPKEYSRKEFYLVNEKIAIDHTELKAYLTNHFVL